MSWSSAKAAQQILPISSPDSVISSFFLAVWLLWFHSIILYYCSWAQNMAPCVHWWNNDSRIQVFSSAGSPTVTHISVLQELPWCKCVFLCTPCCSHTWDRILSVATSAPGAADGCHVMRISHLRSYPESYAGCVCCMLKCWISLPAVIHFLLFICQYQVNSCIFIYFYYYFISQRIVWDIRSNKCC